MFRNIKRTAYLFLAAAVISLPVSAAAQQTADDARAEIEAMMGGVPSFISSVADSALAGLWLQSKQLEFASDTALEPKVKALISLAVAAQIPCTYCIWADTNTARQHGATDQEIAEAVALAGLTRNWSTIFNGMQVDFEQFKQDLGGT